MRLCLLFLLLLQLAAQASPQAVSHHTATHSLHHPPSESDPLPNTATTTHSHTHSHTTDSLRELGLHYYSQQDYTHAQHYLLQAVHHSHYSDAVAVWNYATALYYDDKISDAREFIEYYYHTHSRDIDTVLLSGRLNLCNGFVTLAHERFNEAVRISTFPTSAVVYYQILLYHEEAKLFNEASVYVTKALKNFPQNDEIVFISAIIYFNDEKIEKALELFTQILNHIGSVRASDATVMAASAHQALGHTDTAKHMYQKLHDGDDEAIATATATAIATVESLSPHIYVSYLCNYGLLLKNSRDEVESEKGLHLLQQALEIDPSFEIALINIAMYYREQDDVDKTAEYLHRASQVSSNSRQLEIDIAANTMDEVMLNWERVLAQRREMNRSLSELLAKDPPQSPNFHEFNILNLHFNIQYHSFNDKYLQELMQKVYAKNIKGFSRVSSRIQMPSATLSTTSQVSQESQRIRQPIRIGFMSKSFGVFEPHGLLLDGIVKYLPRSVFKVYVLRVMLDNKSSEHMLSPTLEDYADELVDIPVNHKRAADIVERLQLDIMVFADTLCEPINHYMMFSRYSPIQILFWGNPITSGSLEVDYFMSNDYMEHPYRTRLSSVAEPYTEQVVLLPGQGIWYMAPNSTEFAKSFQIIKNKTADIKNFSREEFGLDPSWFLYMCPQNLFKLHLFFDDVIARILEMSPNAHIAFTVPAKRRILTQKFKDRLELKLKENYSRCHFLPRVSSEQFINFIKIGDILLHPFPFDGSRISADSITAGIPYVTLPAEYLKGRMGASFYRTMDIPELVATNVSNYIDIAVSLSINTSFLEEMRHLISTRSWLIFDDLEVPFAWSQFLLRAIGRKSLSWEDFIESCSDRNIHEETRRRDMRLKNQERFDERRGQEVWLLDDEGTAVLEDDVTGSSLPRIFNNWNRINHVPEQQINGVYSTEMYYGENALHQDGNFLEFRKLISSSGDFEHAIGVGNLLLAKHPNDSTLSFEVGALQLLHGNFETALSLCSVAAEALLAAEETEEAQVYGCLGIAAAHQGIEELSLFALKRSLELRNSSSQIISSLISAHMVEYALVDALSHFKRYEECVEESMVLMHLPAHSEGGAYVLALSAVQWPSGSAFEAIEMTLRGKRNALSSVPSYALFPHIRRVQSTYSHILQLACSCSQRLDSGGDAVRDITSALRMSEVNALNTDFHSGMILVTSLLVHEGQKNLMALVRNLMNPLISEVHILTEGSDQIDLSILPNANKVKQHLQFIDLPLNALKSKVKFAQVSLKGQHVIIAEPHIYLDESIFNLPSPPTVSGQEFSTNQVFALTSWGESNSSSLNFSFSSLVHDTWIFPNSISDCVNTDFEDSFSIVLEVCGYEVVKPWYIVRTIAIP